MHTRGIIAPTLVAAVLVGGAVFLAAPAHAATPTEQAPTASDGPQAANDPQTANLLTMLNDEIVEPVTVLLGVNDS